MNILSHLRSSYFLHITLTHMALHCPSLCISKCIFLVLFVFPKDALFLLNPSQLMSLL